MFLITAIKEVHKNPVSRSPPPCPPSFPQSPATAVCSQPGNGRVGWGQLPHPVPGVRVMLGMLPALGHGTGNGEKLGSPWALPGPAQG